MCKQKCLTFPVTWLGTGCVLVIAGFGRGLKPASWYCASCCTGLLNTSTGCFPSLCCLLAPFSVLPPQQECLSLDARLPQTSPIWVCKHGSSLAVLMLEEGTTEGLARTGLCLLRKIEWQCLSSYSDLLFWQRREDVLPLWPPWHSHFWKDGWLSVPKLWGT